MISSTAITPTNESDVLPDDVINEDRNIMNANEATATKEKNYAVDNVPKSDESNGTRASTDIQIGDTSNSNMDGPMTKWYCSIKLYVGLLLLGFIIYVIIDSATNQHVRDGLVTFLEWIEENPLSGFFLFVIGTFMIFLHDEHWLDVLFCYANLYNILYHLTLLHF